MLAWLLRHSTLCMAGSVVVGLLLQDLARLFAPVVVYVATATMFLSLVRLDTKVFLQHARRPGLAIAIIGWTTLVVPLLVLALVHALPLPSAVAAGILLIAATPPIVSVAAYCVFLGTDAALLTLVSIPATALCVLSLPAFAAWAPGDLPGLAFGPLLIRTFIVVGIAMGGAMLVHRFVPRARIDAAAMPIDGMIIALIVATALGIMDGLAAVIAADPVRSITYFLATFVLNTVLQCLTALVFVRAGVVYAGSAALVGGFRNMALLLGLVIGRVGPELQLFLVMAQIQLFVMPALMRPVYALAGVTRYARGTSIGNR